MKKIITICLVIFAAVLFADSKFATFFLPLVFAHCDTLDGPVVKTAKSALEKGEVTPILKWIKKENEQEIKDLFQKTLVVRNKGKEARELADMYFFETLVRIHRAGENAPYTGLKPAGTVDPAVAEADKALQSGSVENLVKTVTETSAKGIRERFKKASEAQKHADHNVESGREFVEAYVQFTHYVERLHIDATSDPDHHHSDHKKQNEEKQHQH